MTHTTTSTSTTTIAQQARASFLFALPFAFLSVALVLVLDALGVPAMVWLGIVLAATLFVCPVVELILRTPLPRVLQLHYILFIILGPFAGSALHLYGAIERWDTWVHFDSGVMLAWLGMLAVRRAEERAGAPLPAWFSLSVILAVPMAFASAWELCEFASDQIIGTTAQLGVEDIMTDTAAATLGGLLAVALLVALRRPRTLAPQSLLDELTRR